ncbi:isocitrate lyase/phosphoenolpyruvate mutase family protein [Nonomuraea sp. NPDC050404]|uniref:isocitrate lyase/PEP mutase family protein n=1 Tax=Nonomuraea sp. NPDC050404 TaxID=3155783 RepID=UPI0033D473C4
MSTQLERARLFRSYHVPGKPLLLPNAWDVASALIVERAGAQAIATTSAGVSWSLGVADGALDRDRAIRLVAQIVEAVDVPVSADIETGYAEDTAGVADTVQAVIEAGAVGINLEDAHDEGPSPLRSVEDQATRIAAAREAAEAGGLPLFINARTDTYLRATGQSPDVLLEETVSRAQAYLQAGADGVFVPGLIDLTALAAVAGKAGGPINVMAGPGAPAVAQFAAQGAARISLGAGVAEAAYSAALRVARALHTTGTYDETPALVSYTQMNALLTRS